MNRKHPNILMLLVVLCAATLTQASDDTATTFDRWYVLRMSGEHAGYAHTTERHKSGKIVTQTDMRISVKRGDQAITIEHAMWFVETENGKPVESSSSLMAGALPIVHRLKFTDVGIEQTIGQGPGARTTNLPPVDPSYLPPAAAQRRIEQQIKGGAESISAKLIDVSMGVMPLDLTMNIVGRENIEVLGKVVPAVVWEATISNMPGVTVREYVDEQGRTIKSSIQLIPGMDIEMVEADAQLAKAKVDPPEVMARTLVRPDKPIENARHTRRAIYRVSLDERGGAALHLSRAGYQRVVYDDRFTAAVILDLDSPVNVVDDLPSDEHLESSSMIDHQSAAVQKLMDRALPLSDVEMSDVQKASHLRAFVYDYIDEKDLSVGLASAGEVAQTAQGDCTEHAVLLAALLRAHDIPSRTVSGLIYVDEFLGQPGVFGYHMWTQAWLTSDTASVTSTGNKRDASGAGAGRWVDLDAVLDGVDFDASHILLSVSTMRDGQMVNDMIELLPMLGGLEVKVIETE